AIGRPRGTQMRKTGPVFDPAKKQRIAIGQLYCRGVEYAIDLIRPVVPAKDRVTCIPGEQGNICACARPLWSNHGGLRQYRDRGTRCQNVTLTSCSSLFSIGSLAVCISS